MVAGVVAQVAVFVVEQLPVVFGNKLTYQRQISYQLVLQEFFHLPLTFYLYYQLHKHL